MNGVLKVNTPPLNNILHLKYFNGCYQLTGCIAKIDRNKEPFWVIQLSDKTNSVRVYFFNVEINVSKLIPGRHVKIEAVIAKYQDHTYIHGLHLEVVNEPILSIECEGYIVPGALCPIPKTLSELSTIWQQLSSKPLKEFLAEVLRPADVCLPFVQVPASINHHHNYRGGLLDHSVEVANIISCLPYNSSIEKDIAIVCSLLHDIGKVKTLGTDCKRTNIGRYVDHDELTLEICALPLTKLDNADSAAATIIRNIWTCKSPGARYGYSAATPIAHALQSADRLSASYGKSINLKRSSR